MQPVKQLSLLLSRFLSTLQLAGSSSWRTTALLRHQLLSYFFFLAEQKAGSAGVQAAEAAALNLGGFDHSIWARWALDPTLPEPLNFSNKSLRATLPLQTPSALPLQTTSQLSAWLARPAAHSIDVAADQPMVFCCFTGARSCAGIVVNEYLQGARCFVVITAPSSAWWQNCAQGLKKKKGLGHLQQASTAMPSACVYSKGLKHRALQCRNCICFGYAGAV